MGCRELIAGINLSCREQRERYYQNMILINRSHVDQTRIRTNQTQHRVSFNLKEGKSGYLFQGAQTADIFTASFDKTTESGIPFYTHNLQLPISGPDETTRAILGQLDAADYFAAIQMTNGLIEIHGFDNGLTTGDYTYRPGSSMGGAVIPITSRSSEYLPPLVYHASGNENAHFENGFRDIGPVIAGDFNSDFNNDFDNREV